LTARLREKRSKHSRGTHARQEALASFIYNVERYELPRLEKDSPARYRSVVENQLLEAVLEYSDFCEKLDPIYPTKSILAVLNRAKTLGMRIPLGTYRKCQAAITRLRVSDMFTDFPMSHWDTELESTVGRVLGDRPLTVPLYEHVMEAISKLPEVRLRGYLRRFEVPERKLKMPGQKLLAVAMEFKWLADEEGKAVPLYHLLEWYFPRIRNRPHHERPDYGLYEVMNSILITNFVLTEIDVHATGVQWPNH
jgi:hypothetical protein